MQRLSLYTISVQLFSFANYHNEGFFFLRCYMHTSYKITSNFCSLTGIYCHEHYDVKAFLDFNSCHKLHLTQ